MLRWELCAHAVFIHILPYPSPGCMGNHGWRQIARITSPSRHHMGVGWSSEYMLSVTSPSLWSFRVLCFVTFVAVYHEQFWRSPVFLLELPDYTNHISQQWLSTASKQSIDTPLSGKKGYIPNIHECGHGKWLLGNHSFIRLHKWSSCLFCEMVPREQVEIKWERLNCSHASSTQI